MENMTPLSFDDMEKVVGGASKTIQTKSAIVFAGPGTSYGQITSLPKNTTVNFTGNITYSDADGMSFYEINSPLYGWVTKRSLGV